jgi:hypothetical protein
MGVRAVRAATGVQGGAEGSSTIGGSGVPGPATCSVLTERSGCQAAAQSARYTNPTAQMERRERLRKLLAQREAAGEHVEGLPMVGTIVVEEASLQTEVRAWGAQGCVLASALRAEHGGVWG